jgi:predicted RNase H-like nuclease (RuvC/YqgF family)
MHDSFCPKCGFERHILPEHVSDDVRKYENKRIEVCKKVWEERKQGLEKLKKNYEAEVSKNKTLEQSFKEEKAKTRAAEQEKERLKGQVDKVQKELDSAKKEMQGLVDKVQRLISQNRSLQTELDNALRKIEQLKQNPPASAGAQLRIIEEYGKYRLYDVSGIVRRSNGTAIGKSGIELYDGYVFHIGDVSFKVSTPEFNFDNLNFKKIQLWLTNNYGELSALVTSFS